MSKLTEAIARIALLEEPTRRTLYEYVRSRGGPVSRDEGARAAGITRGLAAFHLDRLAEAGLLEVEFRRISGRSGRGAGRPAKLYRPSTARLEVSLPRTRYDLAAAMLLHCVDGRVPRGGAREAIRRVAAERGRAMGRELAPALRASNELARAERALEGLGFEPHRAHDVVRLRDCPFHALVLERPDLVCALNEALVAGLIDGLECAGLVAEFDPDPGGCCVRVRAEAGEPTGATPRAGRRPSSGPHPPS